MSYYYSGYRKKNKPIQSVIIQDQPSPATVTVAKRTAAYRWRLAAFIAATLVFLLLLVTPVWSPATRQQVQANVLEPEKLALEIQELLPESGEKYGIYVKVLETGEEFVAGDGAYMAASCYKMPLGLMLYEMASTGKINLDQKIALTRDDWEAGTGVLQATKAGTEFTIRQLVELAIVESDNIAGNALLRTVGRDNLADFYRKCGARVERGENNASSPRDMGLFAEQVIRLAEKNPELGKELLGYLINSKVKDRLALKLPDDVGIANKIGTWPGAVNDVGITIADHVTYVIAVMSEGVDNPAKGAATIADLSLAVYQHVISRVKAGTTSPSIGRQLLSGSS